jgi:glycosyltransferase involved in cell wall biosynthesis
MSQELATHLKQTGATVMVLCPQPSRPLSMDYRQYLCSRPLITVENGITVARLPSFRSPESKLLNRTIESLSFGYHVCRFMKEAQFAPEAVYINAWPFLAQAMITRYACKRNISVILQIMDVYPEALMAKSPLLIRKVIAAPLTYFDAWIAKKAKAVVVISENMRNVYNQSRGLADDRMLTLYSWQDEKLFENLPSRAIACRRYKIPEQAFTYLFLGNIGPVAGVDYLIRCFADARPSGTQLLIVGDGSERNKCIELARNLGSPNILFISDASVENVPLLQSMADVCLLPLKHGVGMSSVPSKLSAYMLSAKPILASVDLDSDTAKIIRDAQCGWVGNAEDKIWMVDMLKKIAAMPQNDLELIGGRGREYGILHFSKKDGVKKLADLILANCRD